MKKVEYCDNCRKDQPYRVKRRIKTYDVKGIPITANCKVSYCKVCGKWIYVEKNEVANQTILFAKYRKLIDKKSK